MIKLINVSKKYGKNILFKNVNLEIDKAGIYSFIGENGCGKTTLLNIISKFIKASKGKVVNKGKVSFLSQNVNLIPHLKIKEHFKMLRIDENNLKKVRLYNKLESYPFELSQGQRQRIACILCLYSKSPVIVCDEPTSHLDNKSAQIVMKEIIKISKKKIILLVSHDIDLIRNCSSRIYKIENKTIFIEKEEICRKSIQIDKNRRMKLKKYYRKSIRFYRKNSFLFWIICFVNFFILCLSFNFNECINKVINSSVDSALDYNKFYLKKCKEEEKEIIFKVCDNLNEDELNKMKNSNHKIGYNYDLFMNSLYKTDKFNVISTKYYELREGRYPDNYNEIIANDNHKIGEVITLETSQVIKFDKTDIYNRKIELTVVGTVKSSLLLNKDNYYLDYDLVDNYLKNEHLINNKKTLFEYFDNNNFNDYKYVIYFSEIDLLFLKENNIDYLSASYEYYESLKNVSEEIKEYMNYLNVIVVSFSIYYLYKIVKKKVLLKEDEIKFFKALGLKENKIINVIYKENKKIMFNAFISSFFVQIIFLYFIFKDIYISFIIIFFNLIIGCFISKKITSRVVKRRSRI